LNAAQFAYVGDLERCNGWENAVVAIHQAGVDTARAARPLWTHPRYDEIVKRRAVDHEPCQYGRTHSCRCSRCVHHLSWRSRNGRPYRGIEQEAALTAGAK
jgi:hypothetical protein